MIAVIGASGHIGNNLVRQLIEKGEKVKAIIPSFAPRHSLKDIENLTIEGGNVCDLKSLKTALEGVRVVYHLASVISITTGEYDKLHKVNVEGTKNVIAACLHHNVERLVYTGSVHAFEEPPHGITIDENTPIDPKTAIGDYGKTKAAAINEVIKATKNGLNAVVVCPSGVIGPHDYMPSLVGQSFIDFMRGKLPAYIRGAYNFVDVRDVAAGHILAYEKGKVGEVYMLSGDVLHYDEVMRLLARESGKKIPFAIPLKAANVLAKVLEKYAKLRKKRPLLTEYSVHVLQSNCDISNAKAKRDLGYNPRPISETVVDSVSWLKEKHNI
ncbi:MAG: SDR family oxidoreductase [Chitinophagales bacterium]